MLRPSEVGHQRGFGAPGPAFPPLLSLNSRLAAFGPQKFEPVAKRIGVN
jgi:hypothetical protein